MVRARLAAAFFSISGIFDDRFIEVATPQAAEGTLAIKPGVPLERIPAGRRFIEDYRAAGYREPYGAYGPYAYDATNILLEALRQVGPDRAKLVEAIRNIRHRGLLGEVTFDREGQTRLVAVTRYVVQEGKWTVWEDSEYAKGRRKVR